MQNRIVELRCSVVYNPGLEEIEGLLVKCSQVISLLGDVDVDKCVLKCGDSELPLQDSIVAYVKSVGSTVGPYTLYTLHRFGRKPRALIVQDVDLQTLIAALFTDTVLVQVDSRTFQELPHLCKVKLLLKNECRLIVTQ